METKRDTKTSTLTIFPTLDEWERMPQQSKDTYLSKLKHPQWLSESELKKLAPSEKAAYHESFRKCELMQFLLYLAEQQSTTQKGMDANIAAAERICNEVNKKHFTIPSVASGRQLTDLISLREDFIKYCEAIKRKDMALRYESQTAQLNRIENNSAIAADNSQAAVDELKQWRKWLAQIKKPGKHKDAPPIPQVMQQAVIAKWEEYRKECKGKRRATFQGCLDAHGADEIYTNALTNKSYQLIELAHNEAELQDIVHNKQAKDSARKNAEKSKSRQKRKRK